MKKFRIIFGVVCIILAFLVISFPYIKNAAQEKQNSDKKDELLFEIEDLMNETSPTTPIPETTLPIVQDGTTPDSTTPTEPEPTEYVPYRTSTNEEVDGILYISKIDLELPILTNVTEKGLDKTCARVTNTNPPGANNYCVMGHTHKTYGYIFNRLKEVKKGDEVIVKARNYTYKYIIYDKFTTEGLDVGILEDIEDKQIITLFCCSYNVKNGRLVVRGELTEVIANT